MVKSLRKAKVHVKSDERILGDSDFVETVLKRADESFERKYCLNLEGFDMAKVADRVAELLCIDPELIFQSGKQPQKIKVHSVAS